MKRPGPTSGPPPTQPKVVRPQAKPGPSVQPQGKSLQDEKARRLAESSAQADKILQQRKEKLIASQVAETKAMNAEVEKDVHTVEDLIEKALIVSDLVSEGWNAEGEELEERLVDVEGAVEEAEVAFSEADAKIKRMTPKLRRLEEAAREHGLTALAPLQAQLSTFQRKLAPLKGLRKEVEQRLAAKTLVGGMQDQVADTELKLEKACCLILTLSDEAPADQDLVEAEDALKKAQDALSSVRTSVQGVIGDSRSLVKEKVPSMKERIKNAEEQIPGLKKSLAEGAKRRQAQDIVQEAEGKMQRVSDKIDQVLDRDGQVEPEEELSKVLAVVEHIESARIEAQAEVSAARAFVLQKTLEVSRFPESVNHTAKQALEAFKEQLAASAAKLDEVKVVNLERKHRALMEQSREALAQAEALVQKVVEAAEPLSDDSKLLEISPSDIQQASDNTGKAEASANDALVEAQRLVTALQIQARGKDTVEEIKTELATFSKRIIDASKVVSDNKRLATTVNQRIATQHLLGVARSKVVKTDELVKLAVEAVNRLDAFTPKEVDTKTVKVQQKVDGLEAGVEAEDVVQQTDDDQVDIPKPETDDNEEVSAEERAKASAEALKTAEKTMSEAQLAVQTTDIFLETKVRAAVVATEVKELVPRNKKLAEELSATRLRFKEVNEIISVETMLYEARARMNETEAALAKAAEAEESFVQGLQEVSTEASASIWPELDTAVQTVQELVGSTKTFLAMKRIALKQLASERAASTGKQLAEVQSQLDTASKRLHQLLAKAPERRIAAVKHEIASHMAAAKKKLSEAQEGSELLAKTSDDAKLSPDDMQVVCGKADSAQQQAAKAVASVRKLLETRKKDGAKESANGDSDHASDTTLAEELEASLTAIESMGEEVKELKSSLTESEHRFVAKRLAAAATEFVEEAEKRYSTTEQSAAPLIDGEAKDLANCITCSYMIDALKAHFVKVSKHATEFFREMAGDKDANDQMVALDKFVRCLQSMSEEDDSEFPKYSEEELRTIFAYMDDTQTEMLTEAKFLDHFRDRYTCVASVSITSGLDVKCSKSKRKLAVDEVFVASRSPEKDGSVGITRVLGTAEKDKLEGWVTMAGNGGTVFLSKYNRYDACVKGVESALREVDDVSSQASVHLKSKIADLRAVRSGPLADAKTEITGLKDRLRKLETKQQELREKVAAGKRKHLQCVEKEKTRQKQVADRKSAILMTTESTKLVAEAEQAAVPAAAAAEALLCPGALAAADDPAKGLQEASAQMAETLQSVARATADLQERTEVAKRATSGPLAEARSEMAKIKVRLGSLEVKCKRLQGSLQDASAKLLQEAQVSIRKALLRHLHETDTTASSLYTSLLSEEGSTAAIVPVARLRKLLQSLPGCSQLPARQLDMGLQRFGEGFSRFGFLEGLSEYRQCTREVGLMRSSTEGSENSKPSDGDAPASEEPLRKLNTGELVEIIDATDDLGMFQCRALLDSKQGCIPVRNDDDEEVSRVVGKPYYCFSAEQPLQQGLRSNSETIRKLRVGEVVEVLEGPRKEPVIEFVRARCKAMKDDATGFLTMKGKSGQSNLKPCDLLVCTVSIAITTELDVAEGKSIRKLRVGEVLEVVDGISQDTERNLSRAHTRALHDGAEGWVTLKGAQGTTYVEESTRHHTCACSLPLEDQLANGSDSVRTLEQGEMVEVLEGPLKYSKKGSIRMRGRAILDDQDGWITVTKLSSQLWSPTLKVVQATSIDDGPTVSSCKRIRRLNVGELVEAIDPPSLEAKAKVMRVRARAQKDGVIGHITLKGNKGTVFLENAS